ncbi:Squalene/phytoene synthase-domain-containing protein [Naematelia encephala]|uniref:Squalene/phytoene synthase-domain-containing protein n=1 Tax=Naematelia encephala TaxID=71784 RepID=A0A1Y2B0H2_9TREE|nr:Squalene/phytoene synthase-domain-containing protein [Naematelia encephala]
MRAGPCLSSAIPHLIPSTRSRLLVYSRASFAQQRQYANGTSPPKPALNTATTSGGPTDPLAYCSSLVQRFDHEAYLTSYFWPRRERAWFLAWRAFNIELHLITTTVSQPALAAIRFQFWRDALASIWGGAEGKAVPQHPVVVLLADLKRSRPIQRYYLSQLIDVRAKNISAPPSASTLDAHLLAHNPLHSALLLGPLPILLPPTHAATSHISHTLSHLSTLLAAVSMLRNMPVLISSKRQLNLPADVCARHGVVDEDVLRRGAEATGVRDACLEVGTRGMDELITARRDLKDTGGKVDPAAAMPIFLTAVPAERYLQRLEKVDFDVFHPDLQKHDWRLSPRIWWRANTRRL